MSVLFDSNNDLRMGWRFAAFVAVLMPVWLATAFALTIVAQMTIGLDRPLPNLALNVLSSFIPAVAATVFAARVVERAPLQVFGVGFHEGWRKNVGSGLAIAV